MEVTIDLSWLLFFTSIEFLSVLAMYWFVGIGVLVSFIPYVVGSEDIKRQFRRNKTNWVKLPFYLLLVLPWPWPYFVLKKYQEDADLLEKDRSNGWQNRQWLKEHEAFRQQSLANKEPNNDN